MFHVYDDLLIEHHQVWGLLYVQYALKEQNLIYFNFFHGSSERRDSFLLLESSDIQAF